MYELIKINENDYYIDCPSKIGIVKVGENEVVFIDSGNNKDAGKKALRIADEMGWSLKAIYCTHSHADHIGGNKLLQDRTGCKIYANGLECSATNYPIVEPTLFYGGYPYKNIMQKFFMAEKSNCEPLCEQNLPEGMKTVDLSGHCFEMTGYISKDGTAYIGDAVASEQALQKYGVSYIWHINGFLQSLERLKEVKASKFVPSHGEVYDDIIAVADKNIESTIALSEKIVSACETPISFESLLKWLFDDYNIPMNAEQNALISSTLRSYLSYNIDSGKIEFLFKDNIMYYKKCDLKE